MIRRFGYATLRSQSITADAVADTAQEYYYGMLPRLRRKRRQRQVKHDDISRRSGSDLCGKYLVTTKKTANRSTYVSTDVRRRDHATDAAGTDPAVRRFGGLRSISCRAVEAEVDQAQQSTDYVNYVFWNDNSGFLILYGSPEGRPHSSNGIRQMVVRRKTKRRFRKRFTRIHGGSGASSCCWRIHRPRSSRSTIRSQSGMAAAATINAAWFTAWSGRWAPPVPNAAPPEGPPAPGGDHRLDLVPSASPEHGTSTGTDGGTSSSADAAQAAARRAPPASIVDGRPARNTSGHAAS